MEKWIDRLNALQKLPARYPLAIGVLGIVVLSLPSAWADYLGIAELRDKHRGWFGIAVLLALTLAVIQITPVFQKRGRDKESRNARQAKSDEVLQYIEGLSTEERLILAECIRRQQQTIALDMANVAAVALCSKGLLREVGGTGNPRAWPYTIPHFVWRHLNDNPNLLLHEDDWLNVKRNFEHRIEGVHWL